MSHMDKMAARIEELPYLLAERPHTQKELVEHFKADRKTIKNSINTLKKHYKITEKIEGRNVYYSITGGYKRPNFTALEMAALLLAQEAIGSTGLTAISSPFARHAESLLQKVRDSLPADLAEKLVRETCLKQGILPDQLTLHPDRGSSMKSKPLAMLLADLGVAKTHSRPRVSNDNPYSESQFKTMKYRPDFPDSFGSLEDARSLVRPFFDWYNSSSQYSFVLCPLK